MPPVVLGLGSNQGDSVRILADTAAALGTILNDCRAGGVYKTAPLHVKDQADFFNTAVSGIFAGSPYELLEAIHRLEARFGRDRAKERRWGERTLDIDILLFGDLIISDPPLLEVPHPRLKERRFALVPLLDIYPEAADPVTRQSYQTIFESLSGQRITKLG
jgi:2-amino-4-hydroxy-6-hydroxymethyldihydropteridine diphosphokinase